MIPRRTLGLVLVSGALLVGSTSCSRNQPPNLTPDATLAYNKGQVLVALDLVRNGAITGYTYHVNIFTKPLTGSIVLAHSSWLTVMEASKDGWNAAIRSGLRETMKNVPDGVNRILSPWVAAADLALSFIGSRELDQVTSAAVIAKYESDLKASLLTDTQWLAANP